MGSPADVTHTAALSTAPQPQHSLADVLTNERLLFPDPVVINSERWGNNKAIISEHLLCTITAKHFYTHCPIESSQNSCEVSQHPRGLILVLALLSVTIAFTWQRNWSSERWSNFPQITQLVNSWAMFVWQLCSFFWTQLMCIFLIYLYFGALFYSIRNLILFFWFFFISKVTNRSNILWKHFHQPAMKCSEISLGARCLWQLSSLRNFHENWSHIKTNLYFCSYMWMSQITGISCNLASNGWKRNERSKLSFLAFSQWHLHFHFY